VISLPGGTQMPDNPRKWIIDFYVPIRKDRTIFKRFQVIEFNVVKEGHQLSRKAILSERKKNLDLLSAQLECMTYMIEKKLLSYKELCQLI
jgi:hypothetical protein